jgi:hypothetical protein
VLTYSRTRAIPLIMKVSSSTPIFKKSICDNSIVCGRYKLSRRKQIIEEHLLADWDELDWHPRYNIAPTQPVPIIRQNPKEPVREISLVRWGLISSWSKDSSSAAKMINARSETASTLPAFRDAMKFRLMIMTLPSMKLAKTGNYAQNECAPR